MPTNDLHLAVKALKALRSTGTDLALLRPPIDLETERGTSDVDVVVDTEPGTALRRALPTLRAEGIRVAAVWPYDVGGTATVFLFDKAALGGAQLDLLYDPAGIGHYSVRSPALLSSASPDQPLPTVDRTRLLIYEISKRRRKRQAGRLRQALNALDKVPPETLHPLVRDIVTSPSLARLILGTTAGTGRTGWVGRVRAHAQRVANRLAAPVGFWVHSADTHEAANAVRDRFAPVLVAATLQATPSSASRFPLWYATAVAPVRWRPGLVVSWGSDPLWQPDLVLGQGLDVDAAAARVLSAMEQRLF